jgi:hypothetical protein
MHDAGTCRGCRIRCPAKDGVGAACFCMGFLSDKHGVDVTILRGDFRCQDIHWQYRRLVTLCSGCSDGHVLDAHEYVKAQGKCR